jgi:hypothetical protein
MPFSIKLWQVLASDLHEVNRQVLNNEQRLENWVVNAEDPSTILGVEVLLIGRQVKVNDGRIDLLALDSEANLVVLELKRDKTPREIVAQALDYASSVHDFSYEQIETLHKDFTGKPLPQAFSDYFRCPLPKAVNVSHSIIILASELDDSSERIVQYLSENYGVPINVLFFTFFRSAAGEEFLGRAWLKDPEELQERTVARKQAPWLGYYFVNVGEGKHRNWDDCQEYGFLAAGQGEKFSSAMKKLKLGDLVFSYMKNCGYVGFGKVTQLAMMVRDFTPDGFDKRLLNLPLKQPNLSENKDDTLLSEWVVGIKWEKKFGRNDAKKFPGIFANQNIVCKLRDSDTVDYLLGQFGTSETP